jgi:hypothetical protein
MSEMQVRDPFLIPDPYELEHEVERPRWWYAQQLRIAGAAWDEIAQALGYKDGQSAQSTVSKAKRVRGKDELEDIVDLELERLDMLQMHMWPLARQGDTKAAGTILQIMNTRMKLLGTEKKANEVTGTTNTAIFIGGSEAEYVAQLKQAREAKVIEG